MLVRRVAASSLGPLGRGVLGDWATGRGRRLRPALGPEVRNRGSGIEMGSGKGTQLGTPVLQRELMTRGHGAREEHSSDGKGQDFGKHSDFCLRLAVYDSITHHAVLSFIPKKQLRPLHVDAI